MSDYFIGEIRMFGFNFAPSGWALCNGQALTVTQNQALFSVIGTKFGGNGNPNFNLPDLRSRVPFGFSQSQGFAGVGTTGGVENVALTPSQIPPHQHAVLAVNVPGDSVEPNDGTNGGIMATATEGASTSQPSIYGPGPGNLALAAATLAPSGSGAPHTNIQPYLVVNFCISLTGLYPSRG